MMVHSTGHVISGVAMMDEIEIDAYGVITIRLGNDQPAMDITVDTAQEWAAALGKAVTLARQVEESMGDRT